MLIPGVTVECSTFVSLHSGSDCISKGICQDELFAVLRGNLFVGDINIAMGSKQV